MNKIAVFTIFFSLIFQVSNAQLGAKKENFTHEDTLRGTLNLDRTWWDVLRYDIEVRPDYNSKTIRGKTIIHFAVKRNNDQNMQIDLQEPLIIDSIIMNGKNLPVKRQSQNTWLTQISFSKEHEQDKRSSKSDADQNICVYYHGKPREAVRPPWDGGWIWKKDAQGRPWMSVACQGTGASVWYPCKDHQSD